MLKTIEHLPNRILQFKGYAIYVLDDYAVHLQDEIRAALLTRGYILVIIGSGVTGDIQVNDTHYHAPLKAHYREMEMSLMLDKLKENPNKIPTPSRDEIMAMTVDAINKIEVDCSRTSNYYVHILKCRLSNLKVLCLILPYQNY